LFVSSSFAPVLESDAIFCGSGLDEVVTAQNDLVAADWELVRTARTIF
jgi:hypothetical protein